MRMSKIYIILTVFNATGILFLAICMYRQEERLISRLEMIEFNRTQEIVKKINANREMLEIEPLNPTPKNYAEVLESIFDTSQVFMKKSGLE